MANLTLFNSIYNAETERISYVKTYIYGVDWQGEQAITVGDKGLLSANKITCFITFLCEIEENKTYISPGEFSKLNSNELKKYYTFKKGDIIVKGITEFNLSSYEKGKKLNDLEQLYETGTIVSIIPNDFGSEYLRHWEVGAK